jgi:hypothetical protein
MNLEMNTLEDAFVNIGMDEDRILNPNNLKEDQKNDKYTDTDNLAVPNSCSRGNLIFDAFFLLNKYFPYSKSPQLQFLWTVYGFVFEEVLHYHT